MDLKFYKCMHCGNIAIKPFDAGVPLVCCGEKMTELTANTTDAAVEKHVRGARRRLERARRGGQHAASHDSGALHHVHLPVTKNGYQIVELTPEDAPVADFAIAEGDEALKVYEYCNLHGLWVAEV